MKAEYLLALWVYAVQKLSSLGQSASTTAVGFMKHYDAIVYYTYGRPLTKRSQSDECQFYGLDDFTFATPFCFFPSSIITQPVPVTVEEPADAEVLETVDLIEAFEADVDAISIEPTLPEPVIETEAEQEPEHTQQVPFEQVFAQPISPLRTFQFAYISALQLLASRVLIFIGLCSLAGKLRLLAGARGQQVLATLRSVIGEFCGISTAKSFNGTFRFDPLTRHALIFVCARRTTPLRPARSC